MAVNRPGHNGTYVHFHDDTAGGIAILDHRMSSIQEVLFLFIHRIGLSSTTSTTTKPPTTHTITTRVNQNSIFHFNFVHI